MNIPDVYLGTSSWRFDDWKGAFYPPKVDELTYYARQFATVEIDSTWYFSPARRVVEGWRRRVPDDFRFAAKMPRAITHDKRLLDCESELSEFLDAMSALEDKLGPILLQFPPDWSARDGEDALHRFLPMLPQSDWKFAIEFRHASWFHDRTAELLREYNIAWTLADFGHFVPQTYVTADFSYIRWLGDRHEALEPLNEIKKNRESEEDVWAQLIFDLPVREIWGFFNNHWAGFSPGSAQNFARRLGLPPRELPPEPNAQGTLF